MDETIGQGMGRVLSVIKSDSVQLLVFHGRTGPQGSPLRGRPGVALSDALTFSWKRQKPWRMLWLRFTS